MTKVTQISAAALLAAFASTALAAGPAQAATKKVWCEAASAKMSRTACELVKKRKLRYRTPTHDQSPVNFRGRTNEELAARSFNGGENGGRGGKR